MKSKDVRFLRSHIEIVGNFLFLMFKISKN